MCRCACGGADTTARAAQLGRHPAGALLEELCFAAHDEAGRVVPDGVKGKVMCGWMKKARKAVLSGDGDLIQLPPLKLPAEVRAPS